MKRVNLIALALAALALLTAIAVPTAAAALNERGRTETVEFDIAEDATRFFFDQNRVTEDGMPAAGSAFITRGYLYEVGTLSCSETEGCTGVNPDGTPQFPDKVLGEWICQGYFVQDVTEQIRGPVVSTLQLYQIGTTPGARTVTTQGYELADIRVMVSRAITGGTGAFKDARGEQRQRLLGYNPTMGVTLRVKLDVRTR
jgi:hypothetical protein